MDRRRAGANPGIPGQDKNPMRSISFSSLFLAVALAAGCASNQSCCKDSDPQAVVTSVAKEHPGVARLSVHCKQADGTAVACASTAADRKGKASDPEDLEAMTKGQPVVIEQASGIDVTIPILQKDGAFTAACGVTFAANKGREAAVQEATAIAKAVEAGLGCCCKD